MSFMDLKKAAKKYPKENMKGNIECLVEFGEYHCLLAGSDKVAQKVKEKYPGFPDEYIEWIKLCDGGLLFDTPMLSTCTHDKKLDLDFETYEDYNTPECYQDYKLPEGYTIFAVRSDGPVVCFNTKTKDGKVYQWDPETEDFTDIWDTFEDWMTEMINISLKLIADGVLEPMAIKEGTDL